MRRITAVLSAAAVVMMAAGVLAQAKPNFAGKWTRDLTASPIPEGRGGGRGGGGGQLANDLTISQDATTLTLEYMGGGQAPAPVKLVYKLDGSESKNMVMARGAQSEQVSKAVWDGAKIVVTTTTQFGETKRSFAMEGANLAVETTAPGRDGGPGTPTKVIYKKA